MFFVARSFIGLLSWYLFFCQVAFAQANSNNSIENSKQNLLASFQHAIGEQSPLYNGSEYIDYSRTIKQGHPYFDSDSISNGNILYDGIMYENVPFYYDVVSDELAVLALNKIFLVRLKSNLVQEFTTRGHQFKRFVNDSTGNNTLVSGFYEILYGGKSKVIARREKILEEYIVEKELQRKTTVHDSYYIFAENRFQPVSKKATVLSLLSDKRKEIKQFINQNKIRLKENKENALVQIMNYYDQIRK